MEIEINKIEGKDIVFTIVKNGIEVQGKIIHHTYDGCNYEYIVYAQNRLVLITITNSKDYLSDEYGEVIEISYREDQNMELLMEYCSIPELD